MLTAGTKIGSYEILSGLGSGGMGEVYRARDATLHRDVAIKVLRDGGASDPGRIARFALEARALASLNHPHIAAIYGLEDTGAVRALVLELVEGETVAARLVRGPLDLKGALRIARDVADALDAAHEKGIIHRDLKPANVMLTRDEIVKVLDFGVAKVTREVREGGDAPATVTDDATGAGVLLGTAPYMSPEQTRGDAVDKRSDLWAWGCLLFEMLSGRPAFARRTVAETTALILERDPDWLLLPEPTPARVRHLLKRCLEKNLKDRWRDAGDLGIELDDLLQTLDGDTAPGGAAAPAVRRSRWRERLAWAIAATAVAAAAMLIAMRRSDTAPQGAIKFYVSPPRGTTFSFEGGAPWPSISPDGRQLAFVAVSTTGQQQLWVQPLDQADARPVRGTAGAYRPFWSPDSQSIAYFSEGQLWRVDLPDAAPRTLATAPYSGDLKGTWGRDVIVMALTAGLHRVPPAGGPAVPLANGPQLGDQQDLDNITFLPDGDRYIYLVNDKSLQKKYHCVGSVTPRPHTCGIAIGTPVRYAAPGFLLFVQDGLLQAQAFDLERLALSGEARPITDTRMASRDTWYVAPFSISSSGVLAYHPNFAETQLVWFGRTGKPEGRVGALDTYGDARLSADGSRLVFGRTNRANGERDLWLYDLDRDRPSRFTFDRSVEPRGIVSADGQRVVFRATRGGSAALYVKAASGVGTESMLAPVPLSTVPRDWSVDGRYILYQAIDPRTGWDLWVVPAAGGTPTAVVNTQHGEREGRFSPNGRWIAYDSTESGRREIWVQPFPPTGRKWQVSTTGGFSPRWRKDGKELFYVATDGRMMAIPISLGTTVEFDAALPLFQTMLREAAYGAYDVAADGKRFLITMPPEGRDATPITVMTNWMEALRR